VCGYFSGLALALGDDIITTRPFSPRSNRPMSHQFPTFLVMTTTEPSFWIGSSFSALRHDGVEVAACRPGVDLQARPRGARIGRFEGCLLITLYHDHGRLPDSHVHFLSLQQCVLSWRGEPSFLCPHVDRGASPDGQECEDGR